MAPVDESGEPLPEEEGGAPTPRWRGTMLDAALDAASGERWLRDDERGGSCSKPLYATQARWLARLERLFGLAREQAASVVEAIRQRLGLSLTAHARARRQAMSSRRLKERSHALVLLAEEVAMDRELWSRLLGAGHLGELWPEPWLWDPLRRQLAFPSSATNAPRRIRGP